MAKGDVIIGGYEPGAIGRIVELHATYYARHWNFGSYFEAKVAGDLAAFVARPPGEDDRLFCARIDGAPEEGIVGSIAIDGSARDSAGAHLRWFIIKPGMQGRGVGRKLLAAALDFCRARGFPSVYLWTFAGLEAARHLYDAHGFRLAEELRDRTWGGEVLEQRFVLNLSGD